MEQTKVSFSASNLKRVHELISRYPQKQAALLPVLHVAQEQFGYLNSVVIDMVAGMLDITAAHVYGTAKFYDMYRFEPPAEHQFIICRNISCYLCGCEPLKKRLVEKLNIGHNGRSSDGRFSLQEAECLAACDQAPVLMVDEKLYHKVDPDNLPKEVRALLEKR